MKDLVEGQAGPSLRQAFERLGAADQSAGYLPAEVELKQDVGNLAMKGGSSAKYVDKKSG
ncbi:hypothetical protein [Henriciella pelagia]|uniref:hypothetical protein n=1 Tax=Henriciella pelagia TaxID=1977912 RepID=UPI003518B513